MNSPGSRRFSLLTRPEEINQSHAVMPENDQERSEDEHRSEIRPVIVAQDEDIDQDDIGHDREHQQRAKESGLSEEEKRGPGNLRQAENAGVDARVAVVEPGELISVERADGARRKLSGQVELQVRKFACAVHEEQKGAKITQPVEDLGKGTLVLRRVGHSVLKSLPDRGRAWLPFPLIAKGARNGAQVKYRSTESAEH